MTGSLAFSATGSAARSWREHVSGHFEKASLAHFHASEDLPLLVHRREQVAEAADALGRAQDQQTAGVQGVVHQRQELLLRLDIEVDQQVPATEDVQLRKRRIDEDVLRRKDHQVADFFLDPVALALADKKPRQPLRRHVRGDARGKRAPAGLLDGVLVDVGGKDWIGRAVPEASGPPGTP